ncbi:MAG TPA: VWA domain-containing protein, partial [Actinomycetota bacterium]|nr:VWA domain-containing protein [Actinomycetota bacterium]
MVPIVASAQTGSLTTQIRDVSFDSTGHTDITVSVAGPALAASQTLTASDFSVTENGQTVPGLTAQSLSATKTAVSLVLAMDVSSSMSIGGKLAAAKSAAHDFVASLPANVRVALIAFGSDVSVVQDFTTDHTVLNNAIDGLVIAGRTALFDALVQASNILARQLNAQHNVVLFTDGYEGDNNSKATLSDALSALKTSNAAATTVLLGAPGKGLAVLQQVVAAVKGGQSLQASDTSALGAAFARAAKGLTSQYILSYPGTDFGTKDLN